MSLNKKSLESKRTSLPLKADFTKAFQKDWEQKVQSGRFDMQKLKTVMLLLIARDPPLGPEWLDHPLRGNWADHRECHIGGDFLLIYKVLDDTVVFVRTGTHAQLFD